MITYKDLGSAGRIGNQFFELSSTIALAIRNDDKYMFPTWKYEKDFNLHGCFSNDINPTVNYSEPFFHYQEIPHKNTKNQILNLRGYYQSYKYFDDCQDLIQGLLTPKLGFDVKWDCTSIHCRRGDYVNLTNEYAQLDMHYYNAAMEECNTSKYLIVSDDIEYCKSIFKGDKFIFSTAKSEVEDLALQISCENNIIANSSFSWWGAYLNKNPSKKIIAPSKWFGPALPHDTKDLIPPSWIKI